MAPENKQEIDHRTIKLIVGIMAISLASLTSAFATTSITSISASYHEGGLSQSIFVGFLFAIAAFLTAYNGHSRTELVLSKVASAAALGVGLFPCECGNRDPKVPYVHGASAAVMFLVLAFFCYGFYRRAKSKASKEADRRAIIYSLCGWVMIASIVVLAADGLTNRKLSAEIERLVFYGEATGLIAFGTCWLTASRTLPLITTESERFHPLGDSNPS